ncbi:MAG: polyprenyl synthetase family protein [Chloroflexi bacterium]|nr:polyprenyl synthetase family protein [Chloroflexota bacterium]
MLPISVIYEPIQKDMAEVEESLRGTGGDDFLWMAEPLRYVVESGGKRIRPAVTLLVGKFYRCDHERLITLAAAVELFHTGTLVQDDAIDKSAMRRGKPTVNSLWGEGAAVLLGDYLFAKASELACSTGSLRVMSSFAETLKHLSSGELRQFVSAYDWRMEQQEYYKQIESKTASLFSVASRSAAILGEAPGEEEEAFRTYGHNLGMAFQIVDDILDFVGEEEELGKPVGNDLLQGTITLPAILLVEQRQGKPAIREMVQKKGDKVAVERVIDMIRSSDIIQECYRIADEFCAQARLALEGLPQNAYRKSLFDLTRFVIERRK